MSNLKSEYDRILSEIEKAISNEEEKKIVKEKVSELSMIFINSQIWLTFWNLTFTVCIGISPFCFFYYMCYRFHLCDYNTTRRKICKLAGFTI